MPILVLLRLLLPNGGHPLAPIRGRLRETMKATDALLRAVAKKRGNNWLIEMRLSLRGGKREPEELQVLVVASDVTPKLRGPTKDDKDREVLVHLGNQPLLRLRVSKDCKSTLVALLRVVQNKNKRAFMTGVLQNGDTEKSLYRGLILAPDTEGSCTDGCSLYTDPKEAKAAADRLKKALLELNRAETCT